MYTTGFGECHTRGSPKRFIFIQKKDVSFGKKAFLCTIIDHSTTYLLRRSAAVLVTFVCVRVLRVRAPSLRLSVTVIHQLNSSQQTEGINHAKFFDAHAKLDEVTHATARSACPLRTCFLVELLLAALLRRSLHLAI